MYNLYSQRMPMGEVGLDTSPRLRAGLLLGASALEGYALYKVLGASKGWPMYLLGSVVGINILGKLISATLVLKS